jgi:hypothetical protein
MLQPENCKSPNTKTPDIEDLEEMIQMLIAVHAWAKGNLVDKNPHQLPPTRDTAMPSPYGNSLHN